MLCMIKHVLELAKKRLPRDPREAGWYVKGVAEGLRPLLYMLGLERLEVVLLDGAYEARTKGDIHAVIDAIDTAMHEIEYMIRMRRLEC